MSRTTIPLPREQLERVVRQVVRERLAGRPADGAAGRYAPNLVVNISARHLHLCQEHLDRLFGPGSELTVYRWLYQPGEFASEQTVTIVGPRQRAVQNVRVLGPVRSRTQVEISFTDAVALGIDAPVRLSGSLEQTPGCVVLGPRGLVELSQGVIRARRHVHMSPADAAAYGFRDGQEVSLHVHSDCSTVYQGAVCRVDPRFLLEVHLDTDEGNACNLINAAAVELSA